MKTFLHISSLILLATILVLAGCSKKSDGPGSTGKKAKVTITVSNTFSKAEGDYFNATVTASTSTGTTIDWTVNGTRKTGTAITVGTDDFNGGKTIILESSSEFYTGLVKMGGFEMGATPYSVSYKVEVNGSVKDQGNQTIVKNQDPIFTKDIQL
ncbi:hypothetical protein ACLOAU_15365 [Niabella sp. CJ426]|uniref:hypothetical protein n=1 Tax=Niabella sp. CJ426 TaxID=3393740 RepID=UPI003D04B9EE